MASSPNVEYLPPSGEGYNTSTFEVSSTAVDRDVVTHVNFGVYKRNDANKFQYRKLQFDFKNQMLYNIKGEKDTEQRSFRFADVRACIREINENPLAFDILFRDTHPYHIYASSRRDADLMVETLENIISNNKVGLDTTCNLNVVLIKSGAAMAKVAIKGLGVGWNKRWLELYKWQLLIKKEDTDTKPLIVRSLYHVPIAKFTDKQESNGPGKGVQYYVAVLFDDDQIVVRFDTEDLRNEWFIAFLTASQEDAQLTSISKDVEKGKEQLKQMSQKEQELQSQTTGQLAEIRAELSILDRQLKETNDEKQKNLAVVTEIRTKNAALDAEVRKLSVDIVTGEEKTKNAEFSTKTFEDNTAADVTKKAQLESEIISLRGRSENVKQDIVAASEQIKHKQKDLEQLGAKNGEVVAKKHELEAQLHDITRQYSLVEKEALEKAKKTEEKKAFMTAMEAEIESLLAEAKNLASQKDAQQQIISKAREEQNELNDKKTKTKELLHQAEQQITAAKDTYDQTVKQREHTEKQIKDKKEHKNAEALLDELDNSSDDEPVAPIPTNTTTTPTPSSSSTTTTSADPLGGSTSSVVWELPPDSPVVPGLTQEERDRIAQDINAAVVMASEVASEQIVNTVNAAVIAAHNAELVARINGHNVDIAGQVALAAEASVVAANSLADSVVEASAVVQEAFDKSSEAASS